MYLGNKQNKMVGSAGHNFVNWDGGGGSDTEKLENIDEHDLSENGLLLHYDDDSHHVVNNDLNVMIPSVEEGISVEPYIGMMFPSLEDARDFYFEYAKRTGFTIRTNRIRHSVKNMAVIGRDFVCSREGFRAAKHTLRKDRVLPPRPITREGCKAMIRLAARDGSKWVVTKFVKDHNHKLMAHCKFPGDLPTVNILSEVCLLHMNFGIIRLSFILVLCIHCHFNSCPSIR